MNEQLSQVVPDPWRSLFQFLAIPLSWILEMPQTITDGVPDSSVSGLKAGAQELYERIDLKPLEYLSRNVTLRPTYVSPKVGEQWRAYVPRQRVRLWTVDAEVMKGWRNQLQPDADLQEQTKFWRWLKDNVDFRIRANKS